MKRILSLLIIVSAFSISFLGFSGTPPKLKFHGVKVKSHDFTASKIFYLQSLGFEVKKTYSSNLLKLSSSTVPIYLSTASKPSTIPHTTISFQVNKLLPVIDRYRGKGVEFDDSSLQRNGVGIHINFEDPSGNRLSLMEVQLFDTPAIEEPQIYNVGISTNNVSSAEEFYISKMGLQVHSRNYLPNALPLKHSDNSFAFMIHKNEEIETAMKVKYPEESQILFLFETENLIKTIADLKQNGVDLLFDIPKKDLLGSYIAFNDNLGNVFEIYEFY